MERSYIAIDLKSFYASVECRERGLDPMTANLIVADESRTEKTICLAVSPSLRAYGIPARARLFEVIQKVKEINAERRRRYSGKFPVGEYFDSKDLAAHPEAALSYIIATPRMAFYMEYSTRIYNIYLRYIAPEDIHVYSIDEVFIDATPYLENYKMTARELAEKMIKDVLAETGITATVGIGTNLYLSKIAMDMVAKHIPADSSGVRIAQLDEITYRKLLWDHRPLTDFWRIGRGYAERLEANGLYTMGDIAKCSIENEDLLYRIFGINAELLIDHAWGWEPCTIADIKAYRPESSSISSGQVLKCPYSFDKALIVVREMTDLLALDLVEKRLLTNHIELTIGYDVENLMNPGIARYYHGPVTTDSYGRRVPKYAHGTGHTERYTSSSKLLLNCVTELYNRIVNEKLLVRRITVAACQIIPESDIQKTEKYEQIDFFTDIEALEREREENDRALSREKDVQKAVLGIKRKYGNNSILKGMSLQEGATAAERNSQVGGHKA